MSRRTRAITFAGAALACALLAAALARGYRAEVVATYGELRTVVTTREELPARRALTPAAARRMLAIRRVPARFAPPDALAAPEAAVGRAPAAPIPAGSYLLASQLAEPPEPRRAAPAARGGRAPVEIAVSAAGAIRRPGGRAQLVDVVVTTEPGPGRGPGRTYVAARDVRLLDLRPAGDDAGLAPGPSPAGWIATLELDRAQALRLIQAESFARQVRVIGR